MARLIRRPESFVREFETAELTGTADSAEAAKLTRVYAKLAELVEVAS